MEVHSSEAIILAKVLWDYQRLNEKVEKSDVVIAMGCEDVRVAIRAIDLMKDGYANWLICTGKESKYTRKLLFEKGFKTEAAYFASIAYDNGIDPSQVLLEEDATNSGENIKFTKKLIMNNQIDAKRIIVVTAPYSERRQQSTYAAQWPNQIIQITSPQLTFETYTTNTLGMDYLINALVGRVQRMKLYGDSGLQTPVEIPTKIWQAYEKLVDMGFTNQLVT